MNLKSVSAICAVFFFVLGLSFSVSAENYDFSEYQEEEFVDAVRSAVRSLGESYSAICEEDTEVHNKLVTHVLVVRDDYRDEYRPSWCIRMQSARTALLSFLRFKWVPGEVPFVGSDYTVASLTDQELEYLRFGYQEYLEPLEKMKRIQDRGFRSLPEECLDDENVAYVYERLGEWVSDISVVQNDLRTLNLAWDQRLETRDSAVTANFKAGYWH